MNAVDLVDRDRRRDRLSRWTTSRRRAGRRSLVAASAASAHRCRADWRARRRPAARRARWPGRARRRCAGAAANGSAAARATSIEDRGRQREPFGADAEDHDRLRVAGLVDAAGAAKCAGPVGDGSRPATRASSSARRRGAIDRAVAAMDVLLQLRAGAVAAHADAVPAIVDAERRRRAAPSGSSSCHALLRCSSRRARSSQRSARPPRRPAVSCRSGEVDQRLVMIRVEIERLAVDRRRPRTRCRSRRAPGPAGRTPSAEGAACRADASSQRCGRFGEVPWSASRAAPRSRSQRRSVGRRLGRASGGRRLLRRAAGDGAPAAAPRRSARRRAGAARLPASPWRGRRSACGNAKASGTSPRRNRGRAGSRSPTGRRTACPFAVSSRSAHASARSCVGAVEVDQHIAAEDDVVDSRARQQVGGEQIALLEAHQLAHAARTAGSRRRPRRSGGRGSRARRRGRSSCRRRARRACASARALMSTASMRKRLAGEARVEQRHRDRIGLLAGRARQAQDATARRPDALAAILAAPCAPGRRTPRGRGRTRSPARPPLRSAPAAPLGRFAHVLQIGLRIADAAGRQPLLHRALDRGRADRRGVEPDRPLQQVFEVASSPIDRVASVSANSRSRSDGGSSRSTSIHCTGRARRWRPGRDRARRRCSTPDATKSAARARSVSRRPLGDQPEQTRAVRAASG